MQDICYPVEEKASENLSLRSAKRSFKASDGVLDNVKALYRHVICGKNRLENKVWLLVC